MSAGGVYQSNREIPTVRIPCFALYNHTTRAGLALFPIISNTTLGLRSIDRDLQSYCG